MLRDVESNAHSIVDLVRDLFVAIVAGLLVPLVLSYRARNRSVVRGLNRTWHELRHTQKSVDPPVEPFYEDSKSIDSFGEE